MITNVSSDTEFLYSENILSYLIPSEAVGLGRRVPGYSKLTVGHPSRLGVCAQTPCAALTGYMFVILLLPPPEC